jgi:hypothetical protein
MPGKGGAGGGTGGGTTGGSAGSSASGGTGGGAGTTAGGGSGGTGGTGGGGGTGGTTAGAGGTAAGTGGTAAGAGGSAGETAGAGGGAGSSGNAGSPATGGTGSGMYPGTILVEDDFDAATAEGAPDAAKWEPYESWEMANAPTVDTARAKSPPNSVRVQSTSSGRGSFLVPLMGLPVTGNSFYARVFINWEKATTAISGHSGFLVAAAARQNDGAEVRLGISSKGPGGTPRMDLNLIGATDGGGGEVTRYSNGYTDGGNPGDFTGTGFQFEADRWYCLEAHFDGTPNASAFRVWVDGTELEEMHVTDFRGNTSGQPRVNWAPTYTFLKIGAQDYDANLGKIWYDDVFVGTAPVGCDR